MTTREIKELRPLCPESSSALLEHLIAKVEAGQEVEKGDEFFVKKLRQFILNQQSSSIARSAEAI